MSGLNKDDVMKLTIEAGFYGLRGGKGTIYALNQDHMQRFANLVAAAEREACAKVCDAHRNPIDDPTAPVGQYESGGYIMAEFLADAIRARGSDAT